MFNECQITISGWVGGDVSLREVSGGRHVARFRVASTPRLLREGQWVSGATTWHTVTAWNRLATHVAQSLRNGDPVLVHGAFQADTWTREDGTAVSSHVVVARAVGHDLTHGTSTLARTQPDDAARPDAA